MKHFERKNGATKEVLRRARVAMIRFFIKL